MFEARTNIKQSLPVLDGFYLLPISLKASLIAIFGLNIFDTLATLTWVRNRIAWESNPLLADLVYDAPALFVLGKLAVAGLGCYLLWRLRSRHVTVLASQVLVLVYGLLGVYHLQGFSILLG